MSGANAVSAGYFPLLGVKPALGRMFAPSEESAGDPVVVLSDGFWKRRFAGRPAVIDETLLLNGERFRIAGVAPAGFSGMMLGLVADLWIPTATDSRAVPAQAPHDRDLLHNRGARGFFGLARLHPNVSLAQAKAALDSLGERLQREYPASNSGVRFAALSESDGRIFPMLRGSILGASTVVVAVALVVLLIACANVAGAPARPRHGTAGGNRRASGTGRHARAHRGAAAHRSCGTFARRGRHRAGPRLAGDEIPDRHPRHHCARRAAHC